MHMLWQSSGKPQSHGLHKLYPQMSSVTYLQTAACNAFRGVLKIAYGGGVARFKTPTVAVTRLKAMLTRSNQLERCQRCQTTTEEAQLAAFVLCHPRCQRRTPLLLHLAVNINRSNSRIPDMVFTEHRLRLSSNQGRWWWMTMNVCFLKFAKDADLHEHFF